MTNPNRERLARELEALKAATAAQTMAARHTVEAALAAEGTAFALLQAFVLLDDGIFKPDTALNSLRRILGLAQPAVPSSRARGEVSTALYQAQTPDAATDPAIGG